MTSLVFLTIWPLVFQYHSYFIKFPSIFDTFPKLKPNLFGFLKVRQSQQQIMVSSILLENERKITILIFFFIGNTQDSVFLFIFCENWGHMSFTIQSKYGRRNDKTFMKSRLKQKYFYTQSEMVKVKWLVYWSIYFFQIIDQSHAAKGQTISKVNYNIISS